jgi:hypothetical protein
MEGCSCDQLGLDLSKKQRALGKQLNNTTEAAPEPTPAAKRTSAEYLPRSTLENCTHSFGCLAACPFFVLGWIATWDFEIGLDSDEEEMDLGGVCLVSPLLPLPDGSNDKKPWEY